MRPFTAHVTIDAPRERVFDYLADIANHGAFSDHYLKDCRLERLESRGVGASAAYRIAFGRALWGETVITELDAPHRIVLEGQAGRLGRVKTRAVYTLTQQGREMTEVEYEASATPGAGIDRLRNALGGRAWLKLQSRRALRRLAGLLEQPPAPAPSAGVAAG